MNSNIYYFILKVSIQGWPATQKALARLFHSNALNTRIKRRINRANPHRIGTVRLLPRTDFICPSNSQSCG